MQLLYERNENTLQLKIIAVSNEQIWQSADVDDKRFPGTLCPDRQWYIFSHIIQYAKHIY